MSVWDVLQMLVVLGIVLILAVYVIKYGIARLQPDQYVRTGALQVMERLSLGPRNGLYLVRAGERYYLLGVSGENINCLAELEGEELQAFLAQENKNEFKRYLDSFMTGAGENASLKDKVGHFVSKIRTGGQHHDEHKEE